MKTEMTKVQQGLMPQTYAELERWAAKVASTDFVPKEYRGKPNDVLICVQYGSELGLSPVESLRSIAVINGKPSIYGDGLLALCQKSPVYEYVKETPILQGDVVIGYICEAKRRGEDAKVARFTTEDAKRAKLSGKAGPWQEYPQRMLQMRARGFALRDAFADILRGVITREEAMDYPPDPKATPKVAKTIEQPVYAQEAAAPVEEVTPANIIAKMQEHETLDALQMYMANIKPIYLTWDGEVREKVNVEYRRLMAAYEEGCS